MRAARLALRYRGAGVVGFDLAGAELGHPPSEHAAALALARDAGLPLTLHAGEADAASASSRPAGSARAASATACGWSMRWARRAAMRWSTRCARCGLHLEVCPTSNVHTGAAASIADASDHRAVARRHEPVVSHRQPADVVHHACVARPRRCCEQTPLTRADLLRMGIEAARHSFLDAAARAQAEATLRAYLQALDTV